ncbi:site-specific integrase [Flavobacterium weaverense]|uniref:Site-specific recombinase XerD n=1 Tax=Flavobacterium weaverense TaxID=271156 RepID=A0A3L9ZZS5_9FLAO|nr:site-specific integrase [Flavobacterium weaverense]RMA77946.1 site-specific recombinase XerD [Flavobacterium weaverense]
MKNVSILMYLKCRKNAKGESPIYLRVTVDGKRREVSLNESIDSSRWDQNKQRGRGNSETIAILNRRLVSIENNINLISQELVNGGVRVTIESLMNKYTGAEVKTHNLVEVFEYENKRIMKLVKPGTYSKYVAVLNNLKKYLLHQYKLTDLDIKRVDFQFVTDFDYYLRSEIGCANNYTVRTIKTFRQVVRTCLYKGWIDKDPCLNYKSKMVREETGFLTKAEIDSIYSKEFAIKRLDQVRDVFIVSCYTGLAYVDVHLLCKDDIVTNLDGTTWINIHRKKTNTFCNIPILPIVQEIFEKYKDDALVLNSGKLLPVPSNQRMNAYLKEIQDICAIKTLITSHLARHSFATSICRDFGLPLPTLSKIMGHTSMEQTLKYAKLTDQKLNSDVQELKNKLSKSNQATWGNSLSDVS